MNDIILKIIGVGHAYGAKKVLYDVNLDVPRGQFVSLVGPSGCGKSTLFKAVIGTHLADKGEVRIFKVGGAPGGEKVTRPGRDRGIVYQQYSLFPFLTAVENVAIGLMLDGTSIPGRFFRPFAWRRKKRENLERAAEMLKRVRLGESLHVYPHQLSGGMRQRVALAQAMIMQPEVILLDEPFGALDEATREDLQEMLRQLNNDNRGSVSTAGATPLTLIIVTHELTEALYVSDRIVGLTQHWNWEADGLKQSPGATIIYDQLAPRSEDRSARDSMEFKQQREDLRRIVFEPVIKAKRNDHLRAY